MYPDNLNYEFLYLKCIFFPDWHQFAFYHVITFDFLLISCMWFFLKSPKIGLWKLKIFIMDFRKNADILKEIGASG